MQDHDLVLVRIHPTSSNRWLLAIVPLWSLVMSSAHLRPSVGECLQMGTGSLAL